MFAANAELQRGLYRLPPLGRDRDQLADALDIQADKRIARENALLDIDREESAGIVAADAQSGLGEIIGTEAEELRLLGDACGGKRGARKLDHRPDQIF